MARLLREAAARVLHRRAASRQTPAAQVGYKRAGLPDKTNSAAAFGSVIHHALLNVLEREIAHGVPFEEALRKALETFTFYWWGCLRGRYSKSPAVGGTVL